MIGSFKKNMMGTVSFQGRFPGMRKDADWIVYPMKDAQPDIMIQSDTRIGNINLETGRVILSKAHASGAYFNHLYEAAYVATLDAEELFMLKAEIMATASGRAGTNGYVFCDNKGALEAFSPGAQHG